MIRIALLTLAASAAPAYAKTEVAPYLEVGQVLTADLNSGDVLTYSTVAAGVDVSVATRRTEATLSYRYERRISYDDDIGDDDIHSGLARAAIGVGRSLTLEAGGLATRARSDIRGDAPGVLAGNVDNISQVYSIYAGPTLATQVGDLNVGASYRAAYTKVESPGFSGVPVGQPELDNYDSSTSQLAQASIGMDSGKLPFGWTVSGAYEREDAGQLDQRFEGKSARADIVVPVTRTVAVVGGVGYESIKITERDALLDGSGDPVTDGNGRFVTDPNSPRRLAYEIDGIYWDAGVVWRPSSRTTLEARVGRRYNTMSYTGSLSYQVNATTGLQIGVYDSVDSFGRGVTDGLADLPTSFGVQRNPFGDQFGGCTFGTTGAAAGGCLNNVFQSISTSNFRSRGVTGVYSTTRGPWTAGVGLGYSNRRFLANDFGPGFSVNGLSDESYFGQVFASLQLDRNSGIDGNLFANYFESGIAGAPGILSTGATGTYYRNFGRLGTTASVGIYNFDQEGFENDLSAQALLGMRYQF